MALTPDQIANNMAAVKDSMTAAAIAADRQPDEVALVAVSKTHPPDTVAAALATGHRQFGENRVQEAEAKWPALKEAYPEARLHLIGSLQSNKAHSAVALFDVIETIDRPKLARSVARHMNELDRRPDCLIQVNTGDEPQKAGVRPADADALIRLAIDELDLPVTGLMCIPPVDEEPSLHFSFLRKIAERNGLAELSMGMSADYEIAIQFGATLVRVGSAIFGARQAFATAP